MHTHLSFSLFFFFHDPAPTEIYTLSLHDALPIYSRILVDDEQVIIFVNNVYRYVLGLHVCFFVIKDNLNQRSEEHTSELQSRPHLVCRLLLEKKKKEKQVNG